MLKKEKGSEIAERIIDELHYLMDEAIEKISSDKNKDRDMKVVHPSGINSCIKKQVMQLMGIEPEGSHTPQEIRVFENGHSYHERLSHELKTAGVLDFNEKHVESYGKLIAGSIDDICTINIDGQNYIIIADGKTMKDKSYKWAYGGELCNKCYRKYKPHGIDNNYIYQLNCYMWLADIKWAFIISENKDNQERHITWIPRNEWIIRDIKLKVDEIYMYYINNELPDIPANHDLECFDCRYCGYKNQCFNKED